MYSSSEEKNWNDAISTYQKAYSVFPDNGKPNAQIAMIETYRNNYLGMIYWYLLSYCKFYPHPMSKDNLETFYMRILENPQQPLYINDNLREILVFFKMLHKDFTTQRDFKNVYYHISKSIVNLINDSNLLYSNKIETIKEIYIILMAYIYILNESFKMTESSSIHQNIRNYQAICILLMFENLTSNILSINIIISNYDNLANFLFDNEENIDNNNIDSIENENNSVLQLLIPISLCCSWIVNNSEVLTIYKNYSKMYEDNEKSFNDFKKAIFSLINSLNSITEIGNDIEYLPEDCELLGFLPLRSYYSSIDFKSINQIINNDKSFNKRSQFYIRIGRIQAFVNFLVQVIK